MSVLTSGPVLWSVALGLAAALGNVLGGLIIIKTHWARRYLQYFLALGSGFMLATAMLEMIPESYQRVGEKVGALVLGGYLLVHFFEHSIPEHFHFGEEVHAEELAPRVTYTVLGGLMTHAFFDGIAIAAGFLVSQWLGFIIFLAVFLHKIPEGFTMASVMVAGGRGPRMAFRSVVLLGLATLGGVLTMVLFQRGVDYALPLSAGVTIYVAASDLIPEVNREPGIRMAFVVFAGVGLLLMLDRFFRG